jgi:hypothetical protein
MVQELLGIRSKLIAENRPDDVRRFNSIVIGRLFLGNAISHAEPLIREELDRRLQTGGLERVEEFLDFHSNLLKGFGSNEEFERFRRRYLEEVKQKMGANEEQQHQ